MRQSVVAPSLVGVSAASAVGLLLLWNWQLAIGVFLLIVALVVFRRRPLLFVCVFFSWLALQNFVLSLLYKYTSIPASSVLVLIATKEIILVGLLAALVHRVGGSSWRWIAADKWAVAYIALLTVYLVLPGSVLGSAADWETRLVSYRTVVTLVLFYLWGRLSFLAPQDLRRFLVFLTIFHLAVVLFGFYEWAFLPTTFWSEGVGIGDYLLDVKGLRPYWNVVEGLPSNLYRFGIRRMMSVYGDPLAMASASIFPFLMSLAFWQGKPAAGPAREGRLFWLFSGFVIGMGLLLTIGRESIAAAFLSVGLLSLLLRRTRILGVSVALVATLLMVYLPALRHGLDTITFQESAAATHLRFLMGNLELVPDMIIGNGLGEAGGWAFSRFEVETEVGESAYFELMAQCGLASVILLLGFFLAIVLSANRLRPAARAQPYADAVLATLLSVLVARMIMTNFSPSVFAVTPLGAFFYACGAALTSYSPLAHSRAGGSQAGADSFPGRPAPRPEMGVGNPSS